LFREKSGDAFFQVWPLLKTKAGKKQKVIAEGKAVVGGKFAAGAYHLSAKEVRYWASMSVRYDPGQPIVLTSLWVGLGGMAITFIGRMMKEKQRAFSL
jgi:hypothetical protein